MSVKDYYTPKKAPFKTPKSNFNSDKDMSDSEESTTSNDYVIHTGGNGDLSIVAEFDDLMRLVRMQRNDKVEDVFLEFAEQVVQMRSQWQVAVQECRRLQALLDQKTHEYSDLENKLLVARKLLDIEKRHTRKAEEERDSLTIQLSRVRELLFKEVRSTVPEETREKLSFLNDNRYSLDGNGNGIGGIHGQLSAIQEVNTTGSLLSDLSYSRSEDDIDKSFLQNGKTWKKPRPSAGYPAEPAMKKRRSSSSKVVEINNTETVRATTTLTVTKDGPITATSIIESLPTAEPTATPKRKVHDVEPSAPPEEEEPHVKWHRESPKKISNIRQHTFQPKIVVMPENCGPCAKRMRFGRTALKCKDCRALCHPECKDDLPLPCIPQMNTPTNRNLLGYIGDFTPTTPPMVPAIIVHCINEIENKGLNELGIYRIPGSERDVKALKERFLRGKGAPCLSQIDVHVICGTVKDFLRSLHEPLITYSLWKDFVQAVEAVDKQDVTPALYQAISELPQPNRDTLAFMILHFRKVGEAKECKMPIENLAKVFGPTIVGYSSQDPSPNSMITETRQQVQVMESLLRLPTDYWSSFVNVNNLQGPSGKLQQTPSTDSLLRPTTTRGFFTPSITRTYLDVMTNHECSLMNTGFVGMPLIRPLCIDHLEPKMDKLSRGFYRTMGKRKQRFFPTPPSKYT